MSAFRSPRHLWTLLAFSFAVPLLLLAVVAWREYREGFADADRHVERTNAVIYEHTLRLFETFAYALDEVGQHVAGRTAEEIAGAPAVHQYLKRIEEAFPQVGNLSIHDRTGAAVSGSARHPAPAVNISDMDYFIALKDGAARVVSSPTADPAYGKPAFHVAQRRSAPDGSFDGIVMATVPIAELAEFFSRAATAEGDTVSLVRADGTILARHPALSIGLKLTPRSTFMRTMAEAPDAGLFRTVSQGDQIERIFAYRRVGEFPVYVLYGRTVGSVIATWRGHVFFYALFAVPSALLLALVSWLVIRSARAEQAALEQAADEAQRRQRAEEILQKVQRLEMLGQIAGGIAHDFNNLLMVITSNLYLAQTRAGADSPAAPFIDTSMQAAYRGGQLTQQLLTFSRQQTLKPEVVDVNETLGTMVDGMLKRSLRGDIAIETELPSGVWPVKVDRTQMELAVLNLAVNARDAMPSGGALRVRTRNVALDGRAGSPGGLKGDFVALTLADTGCGIDPSIQERVFDPFFTTKDVGKGTGLGLSQVYGFATQAGGTAALSSRPGQGTEITLYLPRSVGERAHSEAAAPTLRSDGKGRAILLVEDSPEIGRTATTLLEGFGYAVTHAENADRALEILDGGKRFDLVFSDIVMPGSMNGLELARSLRARYPKLPVLLTSGYSTASSTATAEGFELLQKPYRPEILAEAVRTRLVERAMA